MARFKLQPAKRLVPRFGWKRSMLIGALIGLVGGVVINVAGSLLDLDQGHWARGWVSSVLIGAISALAVLPPRPSDGESLPQAVSE